MTSLRRKTRIAGWWYLGFSLGPFYLLYVPSKTVVYNSAAATAARVLSHETLWGLWLLPLGWLVARSRFLPRWLGYWLLLDGVAWVAMGIAWFLAPDVADILFRYLQPVFLAELVAMLWLLIGGAKEMEIAPPAVSEAGAGGIV